MNTNLGTTANLVRFLNCHRLLLCLAFIFLPVLHPAPPRAAVVNRLVYSERSGLWGDPSTWSTGMVPFPGQYVVLNAGHEIIYDQPSNFIYQCRRLTILPGARLTFGSEVTNFNVGGSGVGNPGGIFVHGELDVSPGVTLAIDPDGNATREEDGLTILPGGRLVLRGSVLYEGSVTSVIADNGISNIVFMDSSFPGDVDLDRARLVWRSGLRKGRWYDFTWVSGTLLVLDFLRRSNAQRAGEPDYGVGTARVSGDLVTGTGTQWTHALAAGSWWWCDADGPAARVRIRRVISPTSLQLAEPYAGSGCSTADDYWIRDENRPYPGVDIEEQIKIGDSYRIILPATLRSLYGSDETFEEQIFVRVLEGATYHFENASFESVGKEAWEDGEGSGIRIEGFDGTTDPGGLFDTVEVYRYAGEAGLEWEDSTDFNVDWLFLHWAHPMISASNEGHGLKFEHTDGSLSFRNVRVRNARFDRTNDDFVWWATSVGGESGVYDSIGKYCPNGASGHSCDAVDTNDELGFTGGQLAIERNLFANIGAQSGGSCLQAAVGANGPRPAWTDIGWVARDNVCLNLQSVPCLITLGQSHPWDQEQIWAVNNVCAAVLVNGIEGIPNVYQNQVLGFGASRTSGTDGLRNPSQAKGNILMGSGRLDSDDFVGTGVSVGRGLVGLNWSGTTWEVSDNVIVAPTTGIVVSSWSDASSPAVGEARVSHNVLAGHPENAAVVMTRGIVDDHQDPVDYHVSITDNIFEHSAQLGSIAGFGSNQAVQDLIDSNVVRVSQDPAWGGVFVALNDHEVTTGIDPVQGDYELKPESGAWTVPSTDGDKPGPRFAGTLVSRLPILVPGLVSAVDPEDDDQDSDGDGLIDRWDNCPDHPNPGWPDGNGNGLGDECDSGPPSARSSPKDLDQDVYCDACETGARLADADNSGAVDGLDLALLAAAFGGEAGDEVYNPRVDFNRDGSVDEHDLRFLAAHLGAVIPGP